MPAAAELLEKYNIILFVATFKSSTKFHNDPLLQIGRRALGVSENNNVISDVFAATTTTVIVILNGWKYVLNVLKG